MTLRDFPLLADENIDTEVIEFFKSVGFDVIRSTELLPYGAPDAKVLEAAHASRRVVVTHDRDFGALAVAGHQAFTGILFLRPGHVDPTITIESIRTLLSSSMALRSPFILVVERSGDDVRIRVRQPIP